LDPRLQQKGTTNSSRPKIDPEKIAEYRELKKRKKQAKK
jgi:hypothetical protein